MEDKPRILWTCDVPGWAYHNRVKRLSAALPQYRHTILFFGQRLPKDVQRHMIDTADVIVAQGVKALRVVDDKSDGSLHNIVGRLDSVRLDVNGEYVDLWETTKKTEGQ